MQRAPLTSSSAVNPFGASSTFRRTFNPKLKGVRPTQGDGGHEVERRVQSLRGKADRAGKVEAVEAVVLHRLVALHGPRPDVFRDEVLIGAVTGFATRISQGIIEHSRPDVSPKSPPFGPIESGAPSGP